MIRLNPKTTTLVLIDLQNGVLGLPLGPRSGSDVVKAGRELAERFRQVGALVVLVNAAWTRDGGAALRQPVDRPRPVPAGGSTCPCPTSACFLGKLFDGQAGFVPGIPLLKFPGNGLASFCHRRGA